MARVFRASGFAVESHACAERFLARPLPEGDTCLILDLRMPGLNGVEVIERLRGAGASIPIIVYTGYADVPVAVRMMQAGAFDVLEKPFSNELLVSRVRAAMASERKCRQIRNQITDARARLGRLTEREREVAARLVAGDTAPAIARSLNLSARTIEAHRVRILQKIDCPSVVALAQLSLLSELPDEWLAHCVR